MEDETATANVDVTPDLYDKDRLTVARIKFLLVEWPLQNQDGVALWPRNRFCDLRGYCGPCRPATPSAAHGRDVWQRVLVIWNLDRASSRLGER
jgi:hypothetical protein